MEILQNENTLEIPAQSVGILQIGQALSIQMPQQFLDKLNLAKREYLAIEVQGEMLTIEKKQRHRTASERIFEETGLTIEEYDKLHPYDPSCYVEFGRVGSEVI